MQIPSLTRVALNGLSSGSTVTVMSPELHWYVRNCVKEDVHTAIRDGMDLDEMPTLTEHIIDHAKMEKGWTCRFAPFSPELLECACRTRPMCDCAFKGAICTRRLW